MYVPRTLEALDLVKMRARYKRSVDKKSCARGLVVSEVAMVEQPSTLFLCRV